MFVFTYYYEKSPGRPDCSFSDLERGETSVEPVATGQGVVVLNLKKKDAGWM